MVSSTRKSIHSKRSKSRNKRGKTRKTARRYYGGVKRRIDTTLEYDDEQLTPGFLNTLGRKLASGEVTSLSITNMDGSPGRIKQLANIIDNCHTLLHVSIEIPDPLLVMPAGTYTRYAEIMRGHPSIQTFALSVPYINFSDWENVLLENTVMKNLVLLANDIQHMTTPTMLDDIIHGIQHNHTLESLTLKRFRLNSAQVAALCHALRTNINGRIHRLLILPENPQHQREYDAAIQARNAERLRIFNAREQNRIAPILHEQQDLPTNISNLMKQYVSGNDTGEML